MTSEPRARMCPHIGSPMSPTPMTPIMFHAFEEFSGVGTKSSQSLATKT
jgi:hypothetical protein